MSENKAPPFLKGIQAQDPKELLSKATPEQVRGLMKDSFALWAAYSGIESDHRPFSFDDHRYLLPIYLDDSKELVWMKSAQMGATIYLLLKALYKCRYNQIKALFYFPTDEASKALSKDRLGPLLYSSEELREAVSDDTGTLGLKHVTNIYGKKSSLYILYLGGIASKDSVPGDILLFDEVRLVDPADIDQADERVSHSKFQEKTYVSTAGLPSYDIHARFLRGTQNYWHCVCNCLDGFIPSDVFPECIAIKDKEVYLRCPKCDTRINSPQNGRYIPHNPGADFPSYHISQFISNYISPKRIWTFFQTTTNRKEFWNSKLGVPYADKEAMPVNEGTLQACVNTDLLWAKDDPKLKGMRCAMGVDQMPGYNWVMISTRHHDGRMRIIHAEIIESDNPMYYEAGKKVSPFKRIHELMREYNVGLCLIDSMPANNEAVSLAMAFPGKVYLAWYGDAGVDIVRWHDRGGKYKDQIKRGGKEQKLRHQATLHRYMCMDFAMSAIANQDIVMPHPETLTQICREPNTGMFIEQSVMRKYWDHWKSMVREKEDLDDLTGKYRMVYKSTAGDPHGSHVLSYLCQAQARLKRQPIFAIGT